MASWLGDVRDVFADFYLDESAQDLIEYALIGCLVSLAAIAVTTVIPTTIQSGMSQIGKNFHSHIHHDHGKHLGWYK